MHKNGVSEYQYEHASLLLPWYITGKLSETEKEEVEIILEISPKLRRELEHQQQMAQMVREDPEVLNIAAIDTQEQRLDRLISRISHTNNDKRKQQSSTWTRLISKILKGIDVFLEPLSNNWARVAFSLFIVVQVAILAVVINKENDSSTATESDVVYDLAGGSVYVPADKTVLALQFTTQASEKVIDQLFQEIGAQIVEHPEGSTNYTVTLSGSWSEQDIDSLISRLEKNNKIIRLVGRGL